MEICEGVNAFSGLYMGFRGCILLEFICGGGWLVKFVFDYVVD